ncbi:hypothetical protein QF049_001311 [Paenibacillus sp. W4I10]|nr:DUF3888 domain-containing protein [Paenibacillus sp. W4I10]MDQ0720050.1 hypothetical protein [Paenibacillus sp. W4I10]
MKKVLSIIIISVMTLSLSTLAHAQPDTVNEKDFKPLSLTLLNPSIDQVISQYYQKNQKPTPSYGLYDVKVLELKRKSPGEYAFRVVLK